MKKHFFAIALSGVIGLIVGLPHLIIPRLISPGEYDPLQFSYGKGSSITMEEVYTYAPEVREILEGSRFVSDSQVYEYRHSKAPFIGESGDAWIVALLARLSGSLEGGFIASDFVFPFLTSLLVYFLTSVLSRNKIVALGTAAIVVLWSELIALIPYPHAIWTSFLDAFHPRDFLIVSRSFHPQVSLPSYFLAVVLVIVAVRKKRWWISVVAGVVGGFLFYTYVFAWTAFIVGFGIFFIISLIKHKVGIFKHLTVITIIMTVIAFPYIDAVRNFQQSGRSSDFFQKLSLPKRGYSDLVGRHIVFVGLYILVRKKRWTTEDWCFLAFWIAPLVLPNLSQEFLGRDLEGKHWIRRIAYPMSTIGLGMIAISVLPKKLSTVGTGVFLFAVLSRGAILQYTMSRQSAFTYRLDEQKQDLFSWINIHTPPGTVIASLDWEMIASLPAKTHAYNFAPIGMRTVASTQEVAKRYLWLAALLGTTTKSVEQLFSPDGVATTRAFYFTFTNSDSLFYIPMEQQQEIVGRYQDIMFLVQSGAAPPFILDYVIVTRRERDMTKSPSPRLDIVFENEKFQLFRFHPETS